MEPSSSPGQEEDEGGETSSVVCQQQWTLCLSTQGCPKSAHISTEKPKNTIVTLRRTIATCSWPLLQIRIQIRFITLRPAQAVAHLIDWARTLQHHH